MRNHRITKSCFRTCSTCKSHSQAPLCLYTLQMISNHSEGTFERLRYSLCNKGSIPPLPPWKLAFPSLRLLPILYMSHKHSISNYSKAPWGLSVLSRVTCIFTGTIISPSHCGWYCYQHPFSRSYGVILPSSLTRVRSLTLVFSTQLPVSVCGTGSVHLTRSFSRQCDVSCFAT